MQSSAFLAGLAMISVVAALPAQITSRGPLPGCFWYCYLRGDIVLLNGTIAHFDDTPGCSLYPGTECGGVIAGKLQLPSFLFPGFDLAVLDGEWAVCDLSMMSYFFLYFYLRSIAHLSTISATLATVPNRGSVNGSYALHGIDPRSTPCCLHLVHHADI